MDDTGLGLWGVPLAMLAGAIRVSTPFIFVSVGECPDLHVTPLSSDRSIRGLDWKC